MPPNIIINLAGNSNDETIDYDTFAAMWASLDLPTDPAEVARMLAGPPPTQPYIPPPPRDMSPRRVVRYVYNHVLNPHPLHMVDPAELARYLQEHPLRLPPLPPLPVTQRRAPSAVRPWLPYFKAYFRVGGHYYAATGSNQAYQRMSGGSWLRLAAGRIDSRIPPDAPARVDVSIDQHRWERVRRGAVNTFSRNAPTAAFFVALRNMLPADRRALWQGYA